MTSAAILTNLTPFVASHFVMPDGEGGEQLVVIVKITLDVDAQGELSIVEPGVPLHMVDVAAGEPGRSIPLHDADLVLAKPRVDVLVDAHAHAPDPREPCERVVVELHVGTIAKAIAVTGDRAWIDDEPSAPLPFVSMPLDWSRAWGGTRDRERVDERNPLGIGFAGARSSDPSVSSELPNLEDPAAPILHRASEGRPVGFGVVGRAWLPRRTLAGTFDSAWKRERWPLAPRDFDPAFHQSAPADQQLAAYPGGEQVRLVHLTPEGEWAFRLPIVDVPIHFVHADRVVRASTRIDTLRIDAIESQLILTGRASMVVEHRRPPLLEIVVGQVPPARLEARRRGKRHVELRSDPNAHPRSSCLS